MNELIKIKEDMKDLAKTFKLLSKDYNDESKSFKKKDLEYSKSLASKAKAFDFCGEKLLKSIGYGEVL